MKIANLPIAIVFLTIPLPLLGALFNISVYHMPAGFVAAAVILVLSSQKKYAFKKDFLTTFAAPALLILFIIQLVTGRGFVTLAIGGYVLAFTIVFVTFFSTGAGSSLVTLVRGISFMYKFFLVSMLVEIVLITLGFQPQLVRIFPGYKDYNSADVLRYFELMQNDGGLNSVLLGSQIAGTLSLFAAIWFVGIRKFRVEELAIGRSKYWIILSLLMFLITVNGLNFLLLVLACGIYFLYIKKINIVIFAFLLGISTAGLYLLIANNLMFSRIFNQNVVNLDPVALEIYRQYGVLDEIKGLTTMGYYIHEFYSPVANWLAEDWVNKLLGVGAQYFLKNDHMTAGDFGLGIGMLSSGVLWIFIFTFTVFVSCIPALKKVEVGSNEGQLWSMLGAINALITLLWLASTIHYNPAFANPGGMTIFALHFAATLYCRNRVKLSKSIVRHRTVSHEQSS